MWWLLLAAVESTCSSQLIKCTVNNSVYQHKVAAVRLRDSGRSRPDSGHCPVSLSLQPRMICGLSLSYSHLSSPISFISHNPLPYITEFSSIEAPHRSLTVTGAGGGWRFWSVSRKSLLIARYSCVLVVNCRCLSLLIIWAAPDGGSSISRTLTARNWTNSRCPICWWGLSLPLPQHATFLGQRGSGCFNEHQFASNPFTNVPEAVFCVAALERFYSQLRYL